MKRWEPIRGRGSKKFAPPEKWRHHCREDNQQYTMSREQLGFGSDVRPGCFKCGGVPPLQDNVDRAKRIMGAAEAMYAVLANPAPTDAERADARGGWEQAKRTD